MDEEALNTSVRNKNLGVTAQREIEKAVRDAGARGQLKNGERMPAKPSSQWVASTSNLKSTAISSWRE